MTMSAEDHLPPDHHTFGRLHAVPPPLPASMQYGKADGATPAVHQAAQTEDSATQDLDHLVRCIGEW